MTTKELTFKEKQDILKKAAEAAGYTWVHGEVPSGGLYWHENPEETIIWNPYVDGSQALKLAADVLNWPHGGHGFDTAVAALYSVGKLPTDGYEATCLAIVYAASNVRR